MDHNACVTGTLSMEHAYPEHEQVSWSEDLLHHLLLGSNKYE